MKTKHIGNLEIREGDKTDYSKLKEITGDLYIYSSEKLDAPALTSVGGYLYINSEAKLDAKFLKNLNWKSVDGTLFVITNEKTTKGIKVSEGYIIESIPNGKVKKKSCWVAEKGEFMAHGETIKKAISDVQFKIVADKLKKEPIKKDTEFTVKYYRLLTGACDFGCRDWMEKNKIPFEVVDGETVEKTPIKAVDLLPILEKSNAYGLSKFKELITF